MTPLGLQALLYMLVPLLVHGRRRVLAVRSFPILWLVFASAVMTQITLFWLVAFAGSGMAPAGGVLYLRAFASILCFPVLAKLVLAPAERLAAHV